MCLEKRHETVFKHLREFDKSGTDSADFELTVITSVVLLDNGQPLTDMFVMKGIVMDSGRKELVRLECKTSPGWMITTRWITSRYLHDILETKWSDENSKLTTKNKPKHNSIVRIGLMELDQDGNANIVVPKWEDFSKKGLNVTLKATHSSLETLANKEYTLATSETYTGTILKHKYRYCNKIQVFNLKFNLSLDKYHLSFLVSL